MKKIINGRKYDTDTATVICYEFYGNGNSKQTTLYRKKNGEYFFHHEEVYSYRESIEPTDEFTAKEFAEQVMDGDEYETIFGEVEE